MSLQKKIAFPNDDITHLYTLILRNDTTIEIMIDSRSIYNGTTKTSFNPPLNSLQIPSISGYGFNSWIYYASSYFTNVMIASNEKEIKLWNRQDFSRRQRKQITVTKREYKWIDITVVDDVPPVDVCEIIRVRYQKFKSTFLAIPYKGFWITFIFIFASLITLFSLIFCCPAKDDSFKYKAD